MICKVVATLTRPQCVDANNSFSCSVLSLYVSIQNKIDRNPTSWMTHGIIIQFYKRKTWWPALASIWYFDEAFADYEQVKARAHINKLKFSGFMLKRFCYICFASHHNGNVSNILCINNKYLLIDVDLWFQFYLCNGCDVYDKLLWDSYAECWYCLLSLSVVLAALR